MRPSSAALAIETLVKVKQPAYLSGPPGVGKSDVVSQVAAKLGYGFYDIRLSQLDPVDLRGVPSVVHDQYDAKSGRPIGTGITTWNVPEFLPTEGKFILFLDELPSAAQATQSAAYQLILDRKLGKYTLPEDAYVIAAGNRTTDGAIVNKMSTALKNRFVHIHFETNNEDWIKWALENGVAAEVIGFIRFRPKLLNEFVATNDGAEERKRVTAVREGDAFATPRSWSFLSKIMLGKPDRGVEFELYEGTVGKGAAAEFLGYLKTFRNLPDLDGCLMNPKSFDLPEEPTVMYALMTGLAAKSTPDNFDRIVQIADRVSAEYSALLVKDCIARNRSVCNTKSFAKWANKNADILY